MRGVVVVMGIMGSGKTAVGQELCQTFRRYEKSARFFDADDFHPPHNKEKMASGQPLQDR